MAIVILGGLLSATALNMLVLPVLYWRYGPSTVLVRFSEGDTLGARLPAGAAAPEPA